MSMQPVVIRDEETFKTLAEDMKACVINKEESVHRLILFLGYMITLSFSLDLDETSNGKEWCLSMGLVNINSEPSLVPDKFATALAKGFFDSYVENNPPKQGFSNIRHFSSKKV